MIIDMIIYTGCLKQAAFFIAKADDFCG